MKQKPLDVPQYTLGQRLGLAMNQRGMKAPTLAARAGITRQAIYGLIKGRTKNPESALITAICEELLIRSEWLLKEKGSMYPTPELTDEESTLIYSFRELDDKGKRQLLRIAASMAQDSESVPSRSKPFKS